MLYTKFSALSLTSFEDWSESKEGKEEIRNMHDKYIMCMHLLLTLKQEHKKD